MPSVYVGNGRAVYRACLAGLRGREWCEESRVLLRTATAIAAARAAELFDHAGAPGLVGGEAARARLTARGCLWEARERAAIRLYDVLEDRAAAVHGAADPGFAGDGFTRPADEEEAGREEADRAVEGRPDDPSLEVPEHFSRGYSEGE